MALTLKWIEKEIEDCLNGSNSHQNAHDFAMLCIARDELKRLASDSAKPQTQTESVAVMLAAHSADLDVVPTIEHIEKGIEAVSGNVYTPAQRKRVQDAKTWANIIGKG